MKITYTSPNRSHHYPYAKAMHKAGLLHAFVCGFSRLSPRSPFPEIGDKLKRHDVYQTLYLGSIKLNAPSPILSLLNRKSNERLDQASYKWAKNSDVFIYYRTQGYYTTLKLKKQNSNTLCVMEEVNSHVEVADKILFEEYNSLGLTEAYDREVDFDNRLKAYEAADCILCPSEFVKRSFISKGFSPDKLMKVNFGFPPIEVNTNSYSEAQRDTFRVLYVGQLHYRKGLRYAIEAFRKLKHPKKEFVIVGPKTTVTGLEKTQIPDNVIFTGALKGDDLKNQYKSASVFILPSLEEGLALVQGEALAFGIPLLITTNTGGDDIISDGVEGFIVPPADIDALANKLQHMADDQDLLQQMSSNALIAAKTLGSWDVALNRLVSQIDAIKYGATIHERVSLAEAHTENFKF